MSKSVVARIPDEEVPPAVDQPGELRSRAEAELQAISAARSAADASAQAAEVARSKADSESGFAYNAKKNSEEHASFISQTRGQVEADLSWLNTTRKNAEEASQAVTGLRASAESETKAVAEARLASDRDSAQVAALRAAAETASTLTQKAQTDAVAAQQEVATIAAALAAAKGTAEAALAAVQSAQAATASSAVKASGDATSAAEDSGKASAALDEVASVVAALKQAHARVEEHRQQLGEMNTKFTAMMKKVEGLLPHATSAGLASAFREQKMRFRRPLLGWLVALGSALIALFVAGIVGLDTTSNSWDVIVRHFVQRLPLVVPLVWVAIYAGRNFMMTQRLHEEYAYKEAVSTSFEGYKRELSDLTFEASADHPSPLVTLCNNVLQTLALRPGRIYEGKDDDITPLAPLTNAAKAVVDGVPRVTEALSKVAGKQAPTAP